MTTVKFIKFSDHARVPTYANPGDSGADIYCAGIDKDPLWPDETRVFWSDIGIELPPGYEAQVRPRSGLSSRGIICPLGTVDNNYRGNIGVALTNTTREPYPVRPGDRIAQLVIAPVSRAMFEAVEELSPSERGASGFGSTGR
jgi:dUTP pyrophosphatase